MDELDFALGGSGPDGTGAADRLAGSRGEHILQRRYGTGERAGQFYASQMSDRLTPRMTEFIGRMDMAFIATSDAAGDCDCSFRAGQPGFLRVLDDRTIAYPEYRGNGVMASLGNILENPHVGILMIDFSRDLIGLHVNGTAEIAGADYLTGLECPAGPDCLAGPGEDVAASVAGPGKRPVHWVLVRVTEAFVHCSKHIPRLMPQSRVRHWGTDNPRHKGGDYFGVAASRAVPAPAAESTSTPAGAPVGTFML
jgi:uncharacterized protein